MMGIFGLNKTRVKFYSSGVPKIMIIIITMIIIHYII